MLLLGKYPGRNVPRASANLLKPMDHFSEYNLLSTFIIEDNELVKFLKPD